MMLVLLNLIIISFSVVGGYPLIDQNRPCSPRDFGHGSVVCVCNSTYCDQLPPPTPPPKGKVLLISSSKSGKRWHQEIFTPKLEVNDKPDVVLKINSSQKFQNIYGFGGAFTDAAGINILKLPLSLQTTVIEGYYGAMGLEYNLGRIPIGGTDFSIHPYSYDDLPPGQTDPLLKMFRLAREDTELKIPFVKLANEACLNRNSTLKLFASAWSAPGWMKTNGKINGHGKLLTKYYSTWADYTVKFFDAYKERGINFVAMTAQNEPIAGLVSNYPFNSMGWLPHEQGRWIGEYLGPTLKKNNYTLQIFIGDDSRYILPEWANNVMKVESAREFVGGVAVHWYFDQFGPAKLLDITHNNFPDLPILYTEACAGSMPWDLLKVVLGSWERAEQYAMDIIQNLNHWVVGWTDWNLALDETGGPNWVKNFVDSPVITNEKRQEIYRQPMFYALAHFSKLLSEGSQRIGLSVKSEIPFDVNLHSTAFRRPDGSVVLTICNRDDDDAIVNINLDGMAPFDIHVERRSIISVLWNSMDM